MDARLCWDSCLPLPRPTLVPAAGGHQTCLEHALLWPSTRALTCLFTAESWAPT